MPSCWRTQCAPGQRGSTQAGQASGLSCLMRNGRGDPSHTEPTSRRQPQFRTWDMFLGQPLARAMNGMTGRRPLTKTQEHLVE